MLAGMEDRTLEELEDQVGALDAGLAFVERLDVSTTVVSGADARSWLHDLVTADVASLEPHETRPSLLLSPTGHIRASFHVLAVGERELILAQSNDQPATIGDLLSAYVLSSDVTVGPSPFRLFSVPGGTVAPTWAPVWRPSVLGHGFDLLVAVERDRVDDVREHLGRDGLVQTALEAVEIRRIRDGRARFPVDVDEGSLPSEAGFEPMIDLAKGCFLGQESVAKVRNLGHPPRVVVRRRSADPVGAGEEILADESPVGVVTSAAPWDGGVALLARVRWEARDAYLVTAGGVALHRM